MTKKIWRIKQADEQLVAQIASENNLSPIIARIIANRGLHEESEIKRYLFPEKSQFHHPFLMKDLEIGANRIILAKMKKETITIYGDYDVDGITSTSILYLFLLEIGCTVNYYIPDRVNEGYGVNIKAIHCLHEQGTNLVITVDTGITACAQVEAANGLGLDMIITDHHECQEEIPNALAVINPKQKDCHYPFESLAGVGVTFKLIHGIALILGIEDKIWKFLDIVAIGTVADIVPLKDENRIITKLAFATIPKTWNIGLKALMEVTGIQTNKITAGIIGFQIGPRLNAAGRLGDAKRGVELFTSTDGKRVIELATELNEENIRRQNIELQIYKEAVELVEQSVDVTNRKTLVIAKEGWKHGVIGIVASRMVEKYYRPTILLTIEEGVASGSVRSVEGFNVFKALESCKELFIKFGGHEMAAGLSLKAENISLFMEKLEAYALEYMDTTTLIRKMNVDMELQHSDIQLQLIDQITTLEPYGLGNEEPRFILKGEVESIKKIGKELNHLKLKLRLIGKSNVHLNLSLNEKHMNSSIDGIAFNMACAADIYSEDTPISVLCSLNINEWQDKKTAQLMIKDLQFEEDYSKEISLLLETLDSLISTQDFVKLEKTTYPTRKDYQTLYRYLVQLENGGFATVSYAKMKAELKLKNVRELFCYWICIQVFKELGILKCEMGQEQLDFQIIKGKKVELTESKLYNKCIE